MKRLKAFSAALTVALAAVSCGSSNGYTIKGTLAPVEEYKFDSVMMMVGEERNAVAVQNNAFVMEGQIDAPLFTTLEVIYISPETGIVQGTATIPVVVEPGQISVTLQADNSFEIGGTASNDAIHEFNEKVDEWQERDGEWSEIAQIAKEFIAEHSQSQAAVYGIMGAQNVLDNEELAEALNGCAESVKQHPDITPITERMAILERTSEGQPFVDFEVSTADGVVKLSDYVGKGNVVLVDFWASWCGPCRAEIPNVKAIYEEYRNEGLVVVGIPTSDRPEDTRRAVEEDGIPFVQLIGSERQAVGAKAYGVRTIPHLVLFAGDGTILGRGQNVESLREALTKALQ